MEKLRPKLDHLSNSRWKISIKCRPSDTCDIVVVADSISVLSVVSTAQDQMQEIMTERQQAGGGGEKAEGGEIGDADSGMAVQRMCVHSYVMELRCHSCLDNAVRDFSEGATHSSPRPSSSGSSGKKNFESLEALAAGGVAMHIACSVACSTKWRGRHCL